MNMNPHITKAIEILGSQTALAKACGVKQQYVFKWLRMKQLPAERVIQIEKATNGKINRYEMRPDLWHCKCDCDCADSTTTV
jgi:DNA-binding transcriptional regulator YdaS (Cro superfamily)